MLRPDDLGLLELMGFRLPAVADLEDGTANLATTVSGFEARGGDLLVWHSARARFAPGGPDAEMRTVIEHLANLGVQCDPRRAYAVATAGPQLRAVWPLAARGLARWEVRTGVLGQGSGSARVKKMLFLAFGDRLTARMRAGTLLRGQRHAG